MMEQITRIIIFAAMGYFTSVVFMVLEKRRNETMKNSNIDKDLQVKLNTASTFLTEKTDDKYCQNNVTSKEKNVLILSHPDTDGHNRDVEDLSLCLQMYNLHVRNKPEIHFQNWRDFAEKAGELYKDVIIVLSSGLIELCEIYKEKGRFEDSNSVYDIQENKLISDKQWNDKRWNELLEQRNGEYIPCVALDKLRCVIQDRESEVKIHFVTFCDTQVLSQNASTKFYKGDTHILVDDFDDRLNPLLDKRNSKVDGSDHSIAIAKHHNTNESNTFFSSQNQKDYWNFEKQFTFLQTQNTYFHTISRKVIEYFLFSKTEIGKDANTKYSPSLLYVLKSLR